MNKKNVITFTLLTSRTMKKHEVLCKCFRNIILQEERNTLDNKQFRSEVRILQQKH